ncbi:hypothetical protein NQ317_009207, partial [Molorchus minor]
AKLPDRNFSFLLYVILLIILFFLFQKSQSNQNQVVLSKLDFSASGTYSCVVSMETPIFTKDSDSRDLTIIGPVVAFRFNSSSPKLSLVAKERPVKSPTIAELRSRELELNLNEPQRENPVIKFNKNTYEIGEVLEANCTSAPARPPPHITWLINDEKVMDTLTKSFSNGVKHGHGYFDQRALSIKQLSIEVSELHVGDDGTLRLTCMSTIPGYVNNMDSYADIRTATAQSK